MPDLKQSIGAHFRHCFLPIGKNSVSFMYKAVDIVMLYLVAVKVKYHISIAK